MQARAFPNTTWSSSSSRKHCQQRAKSPAATGKTGEEMPIKIQVPIYAPKGKKEKKGMLCLQWSVIEKALFDFIGKDGICLPCPATLAPPGLKTGANVSQEALGGGVAGGAAELALGGFQGLSWERSNSSSGDGGGVLGVDFKKLLGSGGGIVPVDSGKRVAAVGGGGGGGKL